FTIWTLTGRLALAVEWSDSRAARRMPPAAGLHHRGGRIIVGFASSSDREIAKAAGRPRGGENAGHDPGEERTPFRGSARSWIRARRRDGPHGRGRLLCGARSGGSRLVAR